MGRGTKTLIFPLLVLLDPWRRTTNMNTYWRQISDNLQKRVNPGTFKVWIAPLQAELVFATQQSNAIMAPVLRAAHETSATNAVAADSASVQFARDTAEGASGRMTTPASGQVSDNPASAMPLLRVLAPNDFVADWVRSRHAELISAAAEQVLGCPVNLIIEASDLSVSADDSITEAAPVLPSVAVCPGARATRGLLLPIASTQPETPTPTPKRARRTDPLPAPARPVAEQLSLPIRTSAKSFNWRYGFDGFVVGPCNDLAFTAARNMLPDHGAVDTLFLSSGPGLGKTHLTQAVGQALCQSANRRAKVEYLSAESFSNAFVQALKARDIDAFKARFRDVDVLLLEDVHFLQGKEKMQVEVLSTVKALQERGSRVVLTSSFAPRELNNLDPTLVSRFCSGFLAGMDKPDFPTRRRILQDKASKGEVRLTDDVCDLMADRLSGDVRQLEGCLSNLLLRAQMQGSDVSLAMASEILAQYAQESPFFDLDSITRRVCEGFGVSPEQLLARSRRNLNVTARNTAFYLARKHTELSLHDIGEHFNRRHSTVLKGIASVEREIVRETSVGRQIATTLSLIESRVQGPRSGRPV